MRSLLLVLLVVGCGGEAVTGGGGDVALADGGAEAAAEKARPRCDQVTASDLTGMATVTVSRVAGSMPCTGIPAPADAGRLVAGVDQRYKGAIVTLTDVKSAVADGGPACSVSFVEELFPGATACDFIYQGSLLIPSS